MGFYRWILRKSKGGWFFGKKPIKALDLIENFPPETPSLFILKDYANLFKKFSVIRRLKNLSRTVKSQPKNSLLLFQQKLIFGSP